jgi:hypothetical protein
VVNPDPATDVTFEVLGAQPGIARPDLRLSQTLRLTEDLSAGYSSSLESAAPQSVTGDDPVVDVALSQFAFGGYLTLTDRSGASLQPPSLSALRAAASWAPAPSSVGAAALGSGSSARAGAGPMMLRSDPETTSGRSRRHRLADAITRDQADSMLAQLRREWGEPQRQGRNLIFAKAVPQLGQVQLDFDSVVGAVIRVARRRAGRLESVVDRVYEAVDGSYRLSRLVVQVYGSDGAVARSFVTSLRPVTAGGR